MRQQPYDIVILGLTVTSSWGNGHATTWRSLIRGLSARGHRILFLERDMPWYAENRDDPNPEGATTKLYNSLDDLKAKYEAAVTQASLVIVGSYVSEGIQVGEWATSIARGACAFYDIDTPVTLLQLESGAPEYISEELIPKYDAYLSFTGGPILQKLESHYNAPMARALYCSIDHQKYQPLAVQKKWDLGYLGTYSNDRQLLLDRLLLQPAKSWEAGRFAVAGPQYPETTLWGSNVEHFEHLAPAHHAPFYGAQRFTLNITRQAMRLAGYSPSVRLFEAAACGVPIISDWWEGLDSFFQIGEEALVAENAEDTLRYLRDLPEARRLSIGKAARGRVLAEHTPEARAIQVEGYLKEMNDNVSSRASRRDRRGGKVFGRLDSGWTSERSREAASEASLAISGSSVD